MAIEAVNLIAQAALEYAALGWRVIPLHAVRPDGSCTCHRGDQCQQKSRGKHPRLNEWQKAATTEEDVVAGWFEQWPQSNLGVALGADSGIIDLETDGDDGEALLLNAFAGVLPETPTFKSGRGTHRLFKWRSGLPQQASRPITVGGKHVADLKIGAGGKGSQSVFPPSRHWSGTVYHWLPGMSPSEITVAELPDRVFATIINVDGLDSDSASDGPQARPPEHWERIAAGVSEGSRNNDLASAVGKFLRQAIDVESEDGIRTAATFARMVNRGFSPPLADDEFSRTFASVLRLEQQRRAAEMAETLGGLSRPPQKVIAEVVADSGKERKGDDLAEGMRLVIVSDDPPIYELYAPAFAAARGGCLRLSATQLVSPKAIRVACLEQAQFALPAAFDKLWSKKDGLFEQLVRAAEQRESSSVTKRLASAAEWLLNQIQSATHNLGADREPIAQPHDADRRPTKMPDGSVWVRWDALWKEGVLQGSVDKEAQRRVGAALEMSTASTEMHPAKYAAGVKRKRYVVFTKELVSRLEELAEYN